MTRDKKDIPTAYLVERLKWLIKSFVDCAEPRSVRAQVPCPRELAKMTPLPSIGDTLKDALQLREDMIAEEQERIDELHKKTGKPELLSMMSKLKELKYKRVVVLCVDVDNDDPDPEKSKVRMWYFGKVKRIVWRRRKEKAVIEWEVGGKNTEEDLSAEKWASPSCCC